MPFLTVFQAYGKLKSPRCSGVLPGSVFSARWARGRRGKFAPARCLRRQRKPKPSVWASRKPQGSGTGRCRPAQQKTVSLLLMTLRPLKARFVRSHRSAKEQKELRERVDHCVTAELAPFAQRPMFQETESNSSHTT